MIVTRDDGQSVNHRMPGVAAVGQEVMYTIISFLNCVDMIHNVPRANRPEMFLGLLG